VPSVTLLPSARVPLPATIALSWSQSPGGGSCIDRPGLVHKLEATVGQRRVVQAEPADTAIHGTVGPSADGQGWLAVIDARHGDGSVFQRRLSVGGYDCRELDEAIVLVVALMVDSAETQAPPLAVPTRPQGSSVSVGAEAAVAFGMLPGTAFGFGLTSDVRIVPLWPIELWTDLFPTSQTLRSGGAGARFGAWTAGLGLCPLDLVRPGWGLSGCLGATAGEILSSGVGLDVSVSHTRAYAQAELRVGARLRLAGPLFAAADVGAGVPLARDTYTYTQSSGGIDDVFRTAAVVPFGHLAVEVRGP
jgi:hypothetical protein